MIRRGFLGALAAALAVPAGAHTPYRQWVVYRRRHLLIGCDKRDPGGYEEAKRLEALLAEELPAAEARIARAPAATRLASLLATDQLDLALLREEVAREIAAGAGIYAAYGAVDLTTLALTPERVLVAHARFAPDHAALVAEALEHGGATAAGREPPLAWHPGLGL